MKPRKAKISLNPAEMDGDFISTKVAIGVSPPTTTVEFTSLPQLQTAVQSFAKEYGQGCSAYIRIVDGGRKPNGFDAFCNANRFFNL